MMQSKQKILDEVVNRYDKSKRLIVGISGGVASGKTTFANQLKSELSNRKINSQVISTDNFLYSNSVLNQKGIFDQKGFPVSYDFELLISVLEKFRQSDENIYFPVYSHELSNIDETKKEKLNQKTRILILEGVVSLNEQLISFIDYKVFIDTDVNQAYQWFIRRSIENIHLSKNNPNSYYYQFSHFDDKKLVDLASEVWKKTNLKNYNEHIIQNKKYADAIYYWES